MPTPQEAQRQRIRALNKLAKSQTHAATKKQEAEYRELLRAQGKQNER
jgi:hypothetical protein